MNFLSKLNLMSSRSNKVDASKGPLHETMLAPRPFEPLHNLLSDSIVRTRSFWFFQMLHSYAIMAGQMKAPVFICLSWTNQVPGPVEFA
ncbi:hypothetical protein CDAR_411371 [Caerostris darwini]|uniref:Uncharacterized protein n=1 Tax=Caerostris darwini TaxID=1538125 RepID=A0AAV4SEY4_9ARAC|nr:hypothetical protein CDAR_411371 [Caerostris darwini]